MYRVYATLYFIFVVDGSESELGILDLVHVFVESLDHVFSLSCPPLPFSPSLPLSLSPTLSLLSLSLFENVCELDLQLTKRISIN